MADDETLLDAFVAIRPDPNFMQAIDGMADEAIARLMQRMGSATIPAPRMAPLNPGGGGGAGGGGRGGGRNNALANEYTEARRAVQDLEIALRQLRTVNSEIGKGPLGEDLRLVGSDLERLRIELQRGAQDADPLGLRGVPQQIEAIEERLRQVGANVSIGRDLRAQFDDLKEQASRSVVEGRLRATVAQSQIRGLPDADIRQTIVAQTAAVRQQEEEIRRASAAFDGQVESINNLRVALGNLRLAQDALSETQANAAATGRSLNTLSNNAYQLGQAIEDAAVGFSLNGISGAFRGASNNINFLINDFLRLDSVRQKLGSNFADKLLVGSGVGAAVALLVLPPTLEWLETLNDIETKFEDISDLINRDFADLEFRVGLEGTERDFLRSIERAKELRDVIRQLGDIAEQSGDKSQDLQKLFAGVDEGETFSSTLNALREANDLLNTRRQQVERIRDAARFQIDNPAPRNVDPVESRAIAAGRVASAANLEAAISELKTLGPQIQSVVDLYDNLRVARENGIAGASDPQQLRATVKLFEDVKKSIEATFKDLDLADEEAAAKFTSTLNSVQDVIDELSKAAQEIESFSRQLTDGLTAAQRKIAEFTDTQEVIRRQIAGTANDQTLFTLEVSRSAQEFQSLIEKIRTARLELAPTDKLKGLVNQEADAAREALRIETETELLLRQKEVRDELIKATEKQNDRNRRSSLTNFEQYAQQLQKSVLSSDPIDRNTQEIERLNQELVTLDATIAELNANMRLGGSPSQALRQTPLGGFGNFNALGGTLEMMSLVRPENFQPPNEIADAVRFGIADAMKAAASDIVGAQKQTTEAVRQVDMTPRVK
jgi:hypothetical protein